MSQPSDAKSIFKILGLLLLIMVQVQSQDVGCSVTDSVYIVPMTQTVPELGYAVLDCSSACADSFKWYVNGERIEDVTDYEDNTGNLMHSMTADAHNILKFPLQEYSLLENHTNISCQAWFFNIHTGQIVTKCSENSSITLQSLEPLSLSVSCDDETSQMLIQWEEPYSPPDLNIEGYVIKIYSSDGSCITNETEQSYFLSNLPCTSIYVKVCVQASTKAGMGNETCTNDIFPTTAAPTSNTVTSATTAPTTDTSTPDTSTMSTTSAPTTTDTEPTTSGSYKMLSLLSPGYRRHHYGVLLCIVYYYFIL